MGANYSFLTAEDPAIDLDADAVTIKAGYNFNDILGVEARYGVGVSDDSGDVQGIDVKYEMDEVYGAYLTATLPNKTMFKPYVLVGYTSVGSEFEITYLSGPNTYTTINDSDSETGVSYGAGLNVNFTENFTGNIEYASLVDEGELTVDGFSLGLAYRF